MTYFWEISNSIFLLYHLFWYLRRTKYQINYFHWYTCFESFLNICTSIILLVHILIFIFTTIYKFWVIKLWIAIFLCFARSAPLLDEHTHLTPSFDFCWYRAKCGLATQHCLYLLLFISCKCIYGYQVLTYLHMQFIALVGLFTNLVILGSAMGSFW